MQSDKLKRQRRKREISSWLGLQGKSKVNSLEFFSKPLLIKIRVTRVRKCLIHIGNPTTSHHKTEIDNVKSDRHHIKHFLITLIGWMEKEENFIDHNEIPSFRSRLFFHNIYHRPPPWVRT